MLYRSSVTILLCFLIILLTTANSHANNKLTINIAPLAKADESERILIYRRILNDVFSSNYHTQFKKNASAEKTTNAQLYVGHRPPSAHWQRSSLNVGSTDTIYVLYNKAQFTLKNPEDLRELRVTSPLNLSWIREAKIPTTPISINDLMSVPRLMTNDKIDAVVLTGEHVYLANHKDEFQVDVLIESHPLYVYFPGNARGAELKQLFEQRFLALLNSGKIKKLFNNDALFAKANIGINDKQRTIHWHIVPKVYDPTTNELKASSFELSFTEKLKELLPQFRLSTTILSGRMAQQRLSSDQPACVLNAMNIKDESIHKSHLTYNFLSPQLYVYPQDKRILKANNNPMELTELISSNKEVIIGVPDGIIAQKLDEYLPPRLYQRLKLFKPLKYQQMVNMFIARRIDAIIIWPSLLQELIPGPDEARHFGSLEIDIPVFDDIPAFVACNAASPTHKQFIEQVNQLLSQSKSRIALFSSYFEGLDHATQHRLNEKLEQAF